FLDDPTSPTPTICNPTGNVDYLVKVTFISGGQSCEYTAFYPVVVETRVVEEVIADQYLCNGPKTFTAPSGYAFYNWYRANGTLVQPGTSQTFVVNVEGDYYVEYYNSGDICITRSALFRAQRCLDMTKTLANLVPVPGQPNRYTVSYTVTVTNPSQYANEYDLFDMPQFEDDMVILSASYTSTIGLNNPALSVSPAAPGWLLASDRAIAGGNTVHTFTVTAVVTLDLETAATPGDENYLACGEGTNTVPSAGQGLFNRALLDLNDDASFEVIDTACTDVPYLVLTKTHTSTVGTSVNCYDVTYTVTVQNIGGAVGQYDLVDDPNYDTDFVINSAFYLTDATGNPGGNLPIASAFYNLANDQSIAVGKLDTYTITTNVCIDLETPGSPGNEVYTACGTATPGNPTDGEGLYNQARLDVNNDGVADRDAEACDDVPYFTLVKTIASVTPAANGTFDVVYQIEVRNIGGKVGNYDLKDLPDFDDDININTVSYTSTVPSGGPLTVVPPVGGWILANDQSLAAGGLHTYIVNVNTSLELTAGTPGDNTYTACGETIPGTPQAGEGLFNTALLDVNNDGIDDIEDEVCGDLPSISMTKDLVSVSSQLPNGSYNVTYTVVVTNNGGQVGTYDLFDLPIFDDDIVINSGSYTSTIPTNGTLPAVVPSAPGWVLATDQSISTGATQTYTLVVNVSMDLETASSIGDENYVACGEGTGGVPSANQGLYNIASIDANNDGMIDDTDDACGDLPYLILTKSLVSTVNTSLNCYDVTYLVTVENIGGASGQYDLVDDHNFDTDFVVNSSSFTTDALGNPGGNLSVGASFYVLANDQGIVAGKLDSYTITSNVCIDLETLSSPGDEVYTSCETGTPGNPTSGEGLYNEARLDTNNDGTPDRSAEACDDVPYLTLDKQFVSVIQQPDGTYNVLYSIVVRNIGGKAGQYDLSDIPTFDD
ncbi:MAG TPA: hypothetical protein PKD51_20025, partial [Saprospiraceae bacterium]|nr:hypothetical protein [Saprospiraceae bacterium]